MYDDYIMKTFFRDKLEENRKMLRKDIVDEKYSGWYMRSSSESMKIVGMLSSIGTVVDGFCDVPLQYIGLVPFFMI